MNRLVVLLLGLALLLAPLFAAIPEEMVWQSALAAVALIATTLAAVLFRSAPLPSATRLPFILFVALMGWVLISVIGTVATSHPPTSYLDIMLRASSKLASYFGIFAACTLLAYKRREDGYSVLALMTVGGGIAAVIGLQEYAQHVAVHDLQWRIFGTSSPDYLAAYLLLVFPITLALALSVNEKTLKGLLFLVALVEMATIFPTGSRFALLPLVLELILFGVLYLKAQKGRGAASPSMPLIAGVLVCFVLVAATLGKPVIQRLRHNQKNSGAFRVLTWKGSLKMAEANPVMGTGMGTWEYTYQRYAQAGFTRVAHNSYLQLADDSGFLAPAILIILLLATAAVGLKGAMTTTTIEQEEEVSKSDGKAVPILASTDTTMIIGLLAGTIGVSIQNVIDSDWYVFAIGATTAAAAGFMIGLSARQQSTAPDKGRLAMPAIVAVSIAAVAGAIYSGMASVGAAAGQAAKAANPAEAEGLYSNAITWAPLNGRLMSELGYRVQFMGQKNSQASVETLKQAVALMPDSVSYRRLGDVYKMSGQTELAIDAYKHGLQAEPHSVDLLIDLAQIAPKDQAQEYYRELAQQEISPVGQIRALEDITEARYGVADAQVGDDAAAKGDSAGALSYYQRAQSILDKYAQEGGSSDSQHMAMSGGRPDPDADKQYADLYDHVISAAEPLLSSVDRPDYHAGGAIGKARFTMLQANALLVMGNSPGAKAGYADAQKAIQDADAVIQALPEPAKSKRSKELTGLTEALKRRMAQAQ